MRRLSPRLEIDREACIGSAVCVGLAPDLVELSGGKARVKLTSADSADSHTDPWETMQDMVSCCPAAAITLADRPVEDPVSGPTS